MLVDVLSGVHFGVHFLLDLSHVFSTGGVEVCRVQASGNGAEDSDPVPFVGSHDVLFNPEVFLPSVVGSNMALHLVAFIFSFVVGVVSLGAKILVATVLVLLRSSNALSGVFLDPEGWFPVGGISVLSTAVAGDGTDVVALGTATTSLGVVRADNSSSSCAQKGKENVREHVKLRMT